MNQTPVGEAGFQRQVDGHHRHRRAPNDFASGGPLPAAQERRAMNMINHSLHHDAEMMGTMVTTSMLLTAAGQGGCSDFEEVDGISTLGHSSYKGASGSGNAATGSNSSVFCNPDADVQKLE